MYNLKILFRSEGLGIQNIIYLHQSNYIDVLTQQQLVQANDNNAELN